MSSLARTAAVIERGMEEGLHVGAQVYVSLWGEAVADLAFGLARPAGEGRAELAMTPETIVLWLSSGKPLTAVAIAQLWERGLLDLDDAAAKFIPDFAANGKEGITVRHLLTHTAPLRLADTGWPLATWEQMIQRINLTRPEPRWVNGRTAGYSAHITWYILGEIVQRLGGQTLAEYLRDRVFLPCGMENTFIAMTPEEQAANAGRMAVMQLIEGATPVDYSTESARAISVPRPSGSLRGPARELGRFYEVMLRRGRGILSPQAVEAMTARHRVNTLDKTFGAVIDWGLGFMINSAIYGRVETPYQFGPWASPRTFGHSGNQSSAGFADPEKGVVAAVMFNGMAGEVRHQARMRETLGAIYEDLDLAKVE
ncbi:MAG: pbpE 2 [Phycisphaerales bacterium]|nr:pbpE 2 [Phycisphaerales bacterium]